MATRRPPLRTRPPAGSSARGSATPSPWPGGRPVRSSPVSRGAGRGAWELRTWSFPLSHRRPWGPDRRGTPSLAGDARLARAAWLTASAHLPQAMRGERRILPWMLDDSLERCLSTCVPGYLSTWPSANSLSLSRFLFISLPISLCPPSLPQLHARVTLWTLRLFSALEAASDPAGRGGQTARPPFDPVHMQPWRQILRTA